MKRVPWNAIIAGFVTGGSALAGKWVGRALWPDPIVGDRSGADIGPYVTLGIGAILGSIVGNWIAPTTPAREGVPAEARGRWDLKALYRPRWHLVLSVACAVLVLLGLYEVVVAN